jgi:hypothetical protein
MASNQCKNCDRERDLNNNYVNYNSGAYFTTNQNTTNRNLGSNYIRANNTTTTSNTTSSSNLQGTKVQAKIMWGSVTALKELREKEQAEKNRSTQTGRRQ